MSADGSCDACPCCPRLHKRQSAIEPGLHGIPAPLQGVATPTPVLELLGGEPVHLLDALLELLGCQGGG